MSTTPTSSRFTGRRILARMKRPLRSVGSALFVALASALPLGATWSVVAVNLRTREVVVASASCVFQDLRVQVPVIVVGRGGGATQYIPDALARNKIIIRDGFLAGSTPQQILARIQTDGPGSLVVRQIGIASIDGFPVGYTGFSVDAGKAHVNGIAGDWAYAIQGNSLTGPEVILNAEAAFLAAEGDGAQRVMAAMEGARVLGGDGRCSCGFVDPTACGVPPDDFEKAATSAFLMVARIGDTDGDCGQPGCATGDYYLNIRSDTGRVPRLAEQVAAFRAAHLGRPDHYTSTARLDRDALPADGQTAGQLVVRLADIAGEALTKGGATVSVAVAEGPADLVLGPVLDRGDGSYAFEVRAGTLVGLARFEVVADDGVVRATLYPRPELRLDPVTPLHVGVDTISATSGATLPFTLQDAAGAGSAFLLVASGSGTEPGLVVGPHHLPLNPDALLLRSLNRAGTGAFLGSIGRLDGTGRAETTLRLPPGALVNWIGRLDWASIRFGGSLTNLSIDGPVGAVVGD